MSDPDIAVNLLWCDPGRVGGSEEYLVRQLRGLTAVSDFRPAIYCLRSFAAAHPDVADPARTTTIGIAGSPRWRRVLAEHTWLAARTRGSDLVHHGGGTVPALGGTPVVLTIHDLQYLTFPDYVAPIKLRYLRASMPHSVRRADVVAVPSQYVRATVVDAFGIDPDSVVVVPHGVDPPLAEDMIDTIDEAALRSRYGLTGARVLVFPAITHPHKGHRFLVDVLSAAWTDPSIRLVLLGGEGAAEPDLAAAIDRLGVADRVVRTGRVADADRDGLLTIAEALVFPSEYEGFGAPLVEAMGVGTPVICSDQPAVVEVVGDAAVVAPRSIDAWGAALVQVERDRQRLIDAGRRRARCFTTERSGAALAEAYRRALGER